jgi:hypothetical protein
VCAPGSPIVSGHTLYPPIGIQGFATILGKQLWASIMTSATPSGSVPGTRTAAPEARGIGGPRVHQDALYPMSPLGLCDKLVKLVGILRQSCRKRKKTWANVPPSCCVGKSGRRGDRGPPCCVSRGKIVEGDTEKRDYRHR